MKDEEKLRSGHSVMKMCKKMGRTLLHKSKNCVDNEKLKQRASMQKSQSWESKNYLDLIAVEAKAAVRDKIGRKGKEDRGK